MKDIQEFLEKQLHGKNIIRYPHTAGARSIQLATSIRALAEWERTQLQKWQLELHENGECIGCTRQGVPLDMYGNDLAFVYESNGFAAPPEYCDCPKGQMYQRLLTKRRMNYREERVQEHLRYLRYLFGSSCVLPTVTGRWTIDSWPIELEWPEDWDEDDREATFLVRQNVQASVRSYAQYLKIWDKNQQKQGIALFGAPGVGKSGLLRCLEPFMIAQGLSMVSLYIPDLIVALDSDQMEQMISAIIATDVVLFDNLGFLVSAGYRESQGRLALMRLLNARWERNRRTLFTSNVAEEQLEEQLGADSLSRLRALSRFFEVPGIDLRAGKA